MMEPTVTQNSALYFVQHKRSKQRTSLFRRFGAAAKEQRSDLQQQRLRDALFLWPRLHH
jgi:hypothetical protein